MALRSDQQTGAANPSCSMRSHWRSAAATMPSSSVAASSRLRSPRVRCTEGASAGVILSETVSRYRRDDPAPGAASRWPDPRLHQRSGISTDLKAVGSALVEIHGQHDERSLVEYVDAFAAARYVCQDLRNRRRLAEAVAEARRGRRRGAQQHQLQHQPRPRPRNSYFCAIAAAGLKTLSAQGGRGGRAWRDAAPR